MPTVSIIGTSGRKEDESKMTLEIQKEMKRRAIEIIENTFKLEWKDVILVSGSAAYADHIAVELFLEKQNDGTKLNLYLPCNFVETSDKKHQFEDNKKARFWENPGKTSNFYHEKFSKKIGRNTLEEIYIASTKGAILNSDYFGFSNRNEKVSKSDYMIAFTWGDLSNPKSGGTKFTWDRSEGIKVHVPLGNIDALHYHNSSAFKKRKNDEIDVFESQKIVNKKNCF